MKHPHTNRTATAAAVAMTFYVLSAQAAGADAADPAQRAMDLVARMTLEEKASQLQYDSPAIARLAIPRYNWWNEGLHGVARAGNATVFPQSAGEAGG